MKPWEKQNAQKDLIKSVPDIDYIIQTAEEIEDQKVRCLFVLLYLTGARICELVRRKGYDFEPKFKDKEKKIYRYNKTANKDKDKLSIQRKQISFLEMYGRNIVLITIRNQKNRIRKSKEIPIPLDRVENKRLIELISPYINSLGMEDELFPFGYQYSYKRLKQYFNPHWFRHMRATHLTVIYELPTPLLRKYLGWTDDRPAHRYQELRWDDILEKL